MVTIEFKEAAEASPFLFPGGLLPLQQCIEGLHPFFHGITTESLSDKDNLAFGAIICFQKIVRAVALVSYDHFHSSQTSTSYLEFTDLLHNYPYRSYYLKLKYTTMSIPLTGKKKEQAEEFYNNLLKTMLKKKLSFMIGGTYAFMEYTGIERETGDIDIKIPYEEHPSILKTLSEAGYKTELAEIELNWLARVTDEHGFYTDLIYAERNGLYKVENSWFKNSKEGTVLGHKVQLEPVEEMIRSKCYVRNRHRDDSGDVVHLILKQGKNVDWKTIMQKMEPHWELLLSTIVLFLFIYPSQRSVIPRWVIEQLVAKLEDRISHPPTKNQITRGLLLSNDYQVGIANWGFKPITELK